MKKYVCAIVFSLCLLLFCTVVSAEQFGKMECEYDGGLKVFSSGCEGTPESFGFALSDGTGIMHFYHIGASFESSFAAVFKNIPSYEVEVRQFYKNNGVFTYSSPVYVTCGESFSEVTLDEIKTAEKSKLETDKTLYRAEEQAQIDSILSNAFSRIDGFDRKYGIESVAEEAILEISALKTDAEYRAEELATKRTSAISEISNFVNKSDYRPAEQAQIDGIIADATEEINKAEDFAVIDSFVTSAKASLSSLKTDAEYFAEELATKRTTAINEISSFVDKADYRTAEQTQIDSIISDTTEEINKTEDFSVIDNLVSSAKALLSALKTDADYIAEELVGAKEEAVAEISGMVNLSDYREAEVLVIEEIIAEYTALINSATAKSEIAGYVTAAESKLSAVLTDAQLTSNYEANKLVLENLNAALTQLGKIRFFGKEKTLMNILIPVMTEVVNDGTYGRIVITPEYVKEAYGGEEGEIEQVKSIYDSMDPTVEKPGFEAKLAKIDPEVQAFLKEYFLS